MCISATTIASVATASCVAANILAATSVDPIEPPGAVGEKAITAIKEMPEIKEMPKIKEIKEIMAIHILRSPDQIVLTGKVIMESSIFLKRFQTIN